MITQVCGSQHQQAHIPSSNLPPATTNAYTILLFYPFISSLGFCGQEWGLWPSRSPDVTPQPCCVVPDLPPLSWPLFSYLYTQPRGPTAPLTIPRCQAGLALHPTPVPSAPGSFLTSLPAITGWSRDVCSTVLRLMTL